MRDQKMPAMKGQKSVSVKGPKQREVNLINKLIHRETFGTFQPRSTAARPQFLFKRLPQRLTFRLSDIVRRSVLLSGHIFLGFTRDGQYVISYTGTMEVDDQSPHTPVYVFRLQWWLFVPYRPLKKISEVRLFGEHTICSDLFLAVCQWPADDTKVLVYGGDWMQPALTTQTYQCYVSIVAIPPLKPCSLCWEIAVARLDAAVEDNDEPGTSTWNSPPAGCLYHSYAIHFKYNLVPPFPRLSPPICMKCDNTVVINTGDSLVSLKVEAELGDRSKRQSGVHQPVDVDSDDDSSIAFDDIQVDPFELQVNDTILENEEDEIPESVQTSSEMSKSEKHRDEMWEQLTRLTNASNVKPVVARTTAESSEEEENERTPSRQASRKRSHSCISDSPTSSCVSVAETLFSFSEDESGPSPPKIQCQNNFSPPNVENSATKHSDDSSISLSGSPAKIEDLPLSDYLDIPGTTHLLRKIMLSSSEPLEVELGINSGISAKLSPPGSLSEQKEEVRDSKTKSEKLFDQMIASDYRNRASTAFHDRENRFYGRSPSAAESGHLLLTAGPSKENISPRLTSPRSVFGGRTPTSLKGMSFIDVVGVGCSKRINDLALLSPPIPSSSSIESYCTRSGIGMSSSHCVVRTTKYYTDHPISGPEQSDDGASDAGGLDEAIGHASSYTECLSLQVQGCGGVTLLPRSGRKIDRAGGCVMAHQMIFDVEQYIHETLQKLCMDSGIHYLACNDYDVRIIDICSETADVIALARVLLLTTTKTKGLVKDRRPAGCGMARKMYETGFKFVWNIESGKYRMVDADNLTEVSTSMLTATRGRVWNPGLSESDELRDKWRVPTSHTYMVRMMTNIAVVKGESLPMILEPYHHVALVL